MLRLFDSPSDEARAYAADYARTHARDLPVAELVRLANNDARRRPQAGRRPAPARDPRKDVGLDAWGQLLETEHGHDLAAAVLKKHFGAERADARVVRATGCSRRPRRRFEFAKELLAAGPPARRSSAPAFFAALIDRVDDPNDPAAQQRGPRSRWPSWRRFDLNALDPDFLKRLSSTR